jgi:uncharacterized integral membrane protein
MGFWSKLFGRKRKKTQTEPPQDWEHVIFTRDKVNFLDEEQRRRYVEGCLEQMETASADMEEVSAEYSLVTSYLTDMEEVEALPSGEKEGLLLIAQKIQGFEYERVKFREKKNRMPDQEFQRIGSQEEEMEEGIRKMKEAEDYRQLVRQDLKRLDEERHAYEFRRQELDNLMTNYRGMSFVVLIALVLCILLFMILQFVFQMDAFLGYVGGTIAAALVIVILVFKYKEAQTESARVDKAVSKLILLQNKVKIRYVNNANLLEYLYVKYHTDSVKKLEKLWKYYLEEKEERRQFAEAESRVSFYQKELVSLLRRYRIKTPERWIHQVSAILDGREMVELRHELIIRRQTLRKQMDENTMLAKQIRNEIMDVAASFPKFAPEILEMVEAATAHEGGVTRTKA